MPRAKMTALGPRVEILLRIEPELLSRIEAHAARLNVQLPGAKLSRTAAIRVLLIDRLAQLEAEAK